MTLTDANELAVRTIGRRPDWTEVIDTSGAPVATGDGLYLQEAPVTHVDVRLRESLRHRRGRLTVETVSDNGIYSWEVDTVSLSYTASGSATEDEILNAIVRLTNAESLSVRAERRDLSGDGKSDTVVLESNYTSFDVTAASNDLYTLTIQDLGTDRVLERVQYTSGGSATVASIIDGLVQAVNSSDVGARAFAEDTDQDGATDVGFVRPDGRGSLYLVGASIGGALNILNRGRETDNPHYSDTGSNLLALDADARSLDAVRFFTTNAASQAPEGWRLQKEWADVDYRGLSDLVRTAGDERGYLEVLNIDEGQIRSAHLGPAIEE